MSTLTLLLQKSNLGVRIDHGVVARIQGYPESAPRSEAPTFREVVIPASRDRGIDVEVEPGRYSVQAILPSGEILQREARVKAGQTVPITFEAHSPREWLSWQKFEGASLAVRGNESLSLGLPVPPPSQLSIVRQPPGDPSHTWKQAAFAPTAKDFLKGWPQENAIAFKRWRQEGSVSLWEIPGSGNEGGQRWWAISDVGDTIEVVSLPRPWQDDAMNEPALLEILVDSADRGMAARTMLTVRDDVLGGLLAYLGRGRLGATRPLLDSLNKEGLISRTIAGKRRNPLAACAAAYVGLAVFAPEEYETWDGWLPNLMKWFEWLPDGGILHARRIVYRPQSSAERHEVLPALKTAYSRGIPYFAAGVLLLRDMLLVFAAKDGEAREMLDTVSRVASRIDTAQAFTVLRFPEA